MPKQLESQPVPAQWRDALEKVEPENPVLSGNLNATASVVLQTGTAAAAIGVGLFAAAGVHPILRAIVILCSLGAGFAACLAGASMRIPLQEGGIDCSHQETWREQVDTSLTMCLVSIYIALIAGASYILFSLA